ncbi:MAG: hypothetical protein QOG54_1434 [Actinomycetota bacterium]|jgi:hypothetical protein|nr:hypothetical protein [Actinomycetota bacterium]
MTRFSRAATAALSVLLLLGPLALAARPQTPSCPNVVVNGLWKTISAPAFTQGTASLTSYAVEPVNPTTLYASNGQQVWKTSNGGCDWSPVFALDVLPTLDVAVTTLANANIKQIEIPESPAALGRVYLLVEESVGPAYRPHVVVSKDGGVTWKSFEEGLPLVTGGAYSLQFSPGNMDVGYLHVRSNPVDIGDDIYATGDAGSSWEKRNGESIATTGLVIDPIRPEDVWTYGPSGLFHSTDGGQTRGHIESVASGVSMLDVFHGPAAPAQIMAYETETQSFGISKNGGATFTRIASCPGFGQSIAHGNTPDQIVQSAHGNFCQFKSPEYWLPITRPSVEDLWDLQIPRVEYPFVYGRASRSIQVFTGLQLTANLPGVPAQVPNVNPLDTSLQPKKTKLKLKVGESKTVDYHFALPGNPRPLDVFFIVDTSSSMESTIAGLRSGMRRIVADLSRSSLDVQFGVAEFKDYPLPGFGSPDQGDFPYRLNRRIGPADESLVAALERLAASGGGDQPESQLTALYQAATGSGDPGFVSAGQEAAFRPDAVKIIVNITDAQFHRDAAHPSPDYNTVATALAERDIQQIGLSIYGVNGPDGTKDLEDMAGDTGAVAPAGGVDCNEDGSIDVPAGDSLVCLITDFDGSGNMNLAPAIISTVRALTQNVSVELAVPQNPEFVEAIDRALIPIVDVSRNNKLGFHVTFHCTRQLAGSTKTVQLKAKVDTVEISNATAQVTCKKLPKAIKPAKPKVPFVPASAPVIVPATVPALIPAPAPPVIETVGSPQQIAQLQGAVMPQEQEQLQVAAAYNTAKMQNDIAVSEEYQFSSYRDKRQPSPAPLYLSAAVLSMLAGFGLTVRRAPAYRQARRRRR